MNSYKWGFMQKRKLFIILTTILTISLVCLSATCLAPSEAPTLKLEIYDGPDYSESDNICYYRVEATVTGMPEPEIEFGEDDNVNLLGSGRVEVGVEVGGSYTLHTTSTNSAGTATASIILVGECADTDSDDDADVVKEAPTISLAIYVGPLPVEDACVYRVEATVTGNPSPSVSWSKDDSLGSFGNKKAQVNINNPGDTYTLTATATNSEGSDTASVDFSWGCEEIEPEPDPEPIEEIVDIVADPSLSGWIAVDWTAHPGDIQLYVGDTPLDKQAKAYLSFDIDDISDLDDVTINSVSLSMPLDIKVGNPELVTGSQIHIKVYDYGNSLELTDQAIGGEPVMTLVALASLTDINFTSDKLHDELQKAIDADREWFQLKIGPSGILANGIWDYYRFNSSSAVLHVKYETPG